MSRFDVSADFRCWAVLPLSGLLAFAVTVIGLRTTLPSMAAAHPTYGDLFNLHPDHTPDPSEVVYPSDDVLAPSDIDLANSGTLEHQIDVLGASSRKRRVIQEYSQVAPTDEPTCRTAPRPCVLPVRCMTNCSLSSRMRVLSAECRPMILGIMSCTPGDCGD